ncbi:Hypothetical predicted protein [Lecanosticta acicola]|uniref:Uncharacterized protein n=1 Tax=Lecanosticta acicola TaxID=111012 RepID=A0AAI8Z4Y4_9PEZI|nr:Hypothetical predicted protein [Lecanosticta acicola]
MPFVLDYDRHGNVIGGHMVDELPPTPTRLRLQLQQRDTDVKMWPSSRPPTGPAGWQSSSRSTSIQQSQQNCNAHFAGPPDSILAPPTAPAALRRQSHVHHTAGYPRLQQPGPSLGPPSYFYQQPRTPSWPGPQGQPRMGISQPVPPHQGHYSVLNFGTSLSQSISPRPRPMQTPSVVYGTPQYNAPAFQETVMQTPVSFQQEPQAPNLLLQPLDQHPGGSPQCLGPQHTLTPNTSKPTTHVLDSESPRRFVDEFAATFCEDPTALASFEALCKNYNKRRITETEFYVGIYRVLLRGDRLRLLPSFVEFLPPAWKDVDLSWLDKAIEIEHREKTQASSKKEDKSANTPSAAQPRKKKRPINGFTTSSQGGAPLRKRSAAETFSPVVVPPSPTSPPALSEKAIPSCEQKKNGKVTRSGLVKLPINMSLDEEENPVITTKRNRMEKTTESGKRAASTERETPNKKPRLKLGDTLGSEVTHFGPVYPTRRAVLARESRPYIHFACGNGFNHPDDVKAHHKKSGCVGDSKDNEEGWDTHPSCQVGYTQLNYTRCKDGYVVLDQKSHDKIEQAITSGLEDAAKNYQEDNMTENDDQ